MPLINLANPDTILTPEEAIESFRKYNGPLAKKAKDEGDDCTLYLLAAAEAALLSDREHLASLLNSIVQLHHAFGHTRHRDLFETQVSEFAGRLIVGLREIGVCVFE